MVNHESVRLRFRSLSSFLDERMRRLVAAAESLKVSDQQMAELQLRRESSMATGTISSYPEVDTLIY